MHVCMYTLEHGNRHWNHKGVYPPLQIPCNDEAHIYLVFILTKAFEVGARDRAVESVRRRRRFASENLSFRTCKIHTLTHTHTYNIYLYIYVRKFSCPRGVLIFYILCQRGFRAARRPLTPSGVW